MAHWEKVFIVLGMNDQGAALLAGPVASAQAARELAADKVRTDAQWRRAFVFQSLFGYDFHLSPDAPGGAVQERVRAKHFPDVPPMVGGPACSETASTEDDDAPPPVRDLYRRLKDSDVWHFCPECSNYPNKKGSLERVTKPTTGELCDECIAKEKKEAKA